MSRRRRSKKGNGEAILFVIALVMIVSIISAIAKFIQENASTFIIILIIVLIVNGIVFGIKIYNHIKIKKEYLSSPYYLFTKIPFKIMKMNKGLEYECFVFNKLSKKYNNESILLTNLLIPRKNSINEYAEIDIIFIHKTGVYVLELKNYSGFIYGNLEGKYWSIGYDNEGKKNVYEFLNPVLQNKKHIEDLSKYIELEYKNFVIFSKSTNIKSSIDNVLYLDNFIDIVSKQEFIYGFEEIKTIESEILKHNVYENISDHIERIAYNEVKYSKYRKR